MIAFASVDRVKPGASPCPLCHQPLRFFVGGYGETLEVCESQDCANAVPHHPVSVGLPLKPFAGPKRRRAKKA